MKNGRRRRHKQFWGLHAKPSNSFKVFLGAMPFLFVIALYAVTSMIRHSANPEDKLFPTISQMAIAFAKFSYNASGGEGSEFFQMLWNPDTLPWLRERVVGIFTSNLMIDTISSLLRILAGISLSTLAGLLVGVNMGLFAGFRNLVKPFMIFILNVPPLALLPILLITFNVGELSKIMLIFIGTYPAITMSVYLAVRAIPWELVIKAQTLGATSFGVTYRIIVKMIIPNLLNVVSISLGAAWLFLISAEAIASTTGLGYRIFLVRRYLSMDVIIPYVLWITFLAFLITWGVSRFINKHYSWFNSLNGERK